MNPDDQATRELLSTLRLTLPEGEGKNILGWVWLHIGYEGGRYGVGRYLANRRSSCERFDTQEVAQ